MTDTPGGNDSERWANTVPGSGDADETFEVYLPFDPDNDPAGATHVAHMRGNRDEFLDLLAGFVETGSDLSAPLRERGASTPDKMRFALEGLGPARVESLEEL
jgi:hypothetical protein